MKVTVIELWKGKKHTTEYTFDNEEQKQAFIKMCRESKIIVVDHKEKNQVS